MNILSTAMIFIACLGLLSCASDPESMSDKDVLSPSNPENVVVQKVGSNVPVLSPESRSHWISAMESNDGSIESIHGMLALGKGSAAERAARNYLEKKPGDIQGLVALASALVISRQFDLAAYYGKLVSKSLPNNSLSLNIEALSLLVEARTIRDYKKVEKLLSTGFNSSPSEIATGLNLGSIYLDLGDAQSAYDMYSKTLDRCGNCYPAVMGAGISARRTNRADEAISLFNKALSLEEEDPQANYQLALVYKNNKDNSEKSISYLETILNGNKADSTLKDHAHTLLRSLKSVRTGEAPKEEEEQQASEPEKVKTQEDLENDSEQEEQRPVETEDVEEETNQEPGDFTLEGEDSQ